MATDHNAIYLVSHGHGSQRNIPGVTRPRITKQYTWCHTATDYDAIYLVSHGHGSQSSELVTIFSHIQHHAKVICIPNIWDSHSGVAEDSRLLRCDAVSVGKWLQPVRKIVSSSSRLMKVPWDRQRRHDPSKPGEHFTQRHGVTSQKNRVPIIENYFDESVMVNVETSPWTAWFWRWTRHDPPKRR
jgi:hypothetical protein